MTSLQRCLQTSRLLVIAYVLLWPPLLVLITRQSYVPEVLGWWSKRVFILLVASGIFMVIVSSALIVCLRNAKLLSNIENGFVRLRRNRVLAIVVAAAPVLTWLAIVVYLARISVRLDWRLLFSLVDIALLVLVAESALLFAGREPREQRMLMMKCTLAAGAFVFAIGMVEVVGAVLRLSPYAHWDVNPKNLDVRFQTDDFDVRVVTNNQGLRELHEVKRRHPGIYRIVVIGDSFTFGWGVNNEEAYPKVSESLLRDKYGWKNVEVINIGKPGAAPHDYLRFLKRYAVLLEPDLIVVGFLIGDDCPVVSPATLSSEKNVQLAQALHVKTARVNPVERLLFKSYIARLTHARVVGRLRRTTAATGEGKRGPLFGEPNPLDPTQMAKALQDHADPVSATARYEKLKRDGWVEKGMKWQVNPWLIRAIVLRPGGIADSLAVRPQTKEFMHYEWRLCEELMLEMLATAKGIQADMMILAIPNAHLVSQPWVDLLKQLGCEVFDNMTTSQIVNDWMKRFCDKHEIPHIDPLAEYRARAQAGETLYLKTDDHMNAAGYRLLGEVLAEAINKRGKFGSK